MLVNFIGNVFSSLFFFLGFHKVMEADDCLSCFFEQKCG